jgi:hypothetical protein
VPLDYNLDALGWYNFERLVQGLLKDLIGSGVSSFGGSKDQGRDACLKSASAPFPTKETRWNGNWIFQVKFVDVGLRGQAAARRALLRTFESELKYILNRATSPIGRKLKRVDIYVLITNVIVTPSVDDELRATFSRYHKGKFHVISGKDICDYLRERGDLRRSFPQLLGLADLELIVNATVRRRSKTYLSRYQRELGTFVRTAAYERAWEKLRKHRFIVLDGPPEIGKSFICAALAVLFATEGFEIIEVKTPDDVWANHKSGRKQLFVADDAVGTITLEAPTASAWERDLKKILTLLHSDHYMIWTARRYILEAAIETTKLGSIGGGFPELNEVVVEADSLSEREKAEILYNHAKHANLSEHCRKLIRDNAAKIVNHKNYYPERIRALTYEKLRGALDGESWSPDEVTWKGIDEFLRNPSKSWNAAFDKLTPEEQALLLCLMDFTHGTTADTLKSAFHYRSEESFSLSFEQCIDRLNNSFIRASNSYWSNQKLINFAHPSIRDMLTVKLASVSAARSAYIDSVSPSGIPALIQALSGTTDDDKEGIIQANTPADVETLIARIARLPSEGCKAAEWRDIVLSCRRLLPCGSDGKLLEPAEVDLDDFSASPLGRVLRGVLSDVCDERVIPIVSRLFGSGLLDFIEMYYELTPYLSPHLPFSGITAVSGRSLEPVDKLRFVKVLERWEPIILRQAFSSSEIDDIIHSVEEKLQT